MKIDFITAKEAYAITLLEGTIDEEKYKHYLIDTITTLIKQAVYDGRCEAFYNLGEIIRNYGLPLSYSSLKYKSAVKISDEVKKAFEELGYKIYYDAPWDHYRISWYLDEEK